MILDATAGNRHLWGKNKYPEGVVFFDKEKNLRIPPDVLGTWDKLPFPDNSFDCIIFDPPHIFNENNMYNRDPKAMPNGSTKTPGWYGAFKSKNDAVIQIIKAQREFARVSSRMCFKWNETNMSLNNTLGLFDCWNVQFITQQQRRGNKPMTYWVKMVRK